MARLLGILRRRRFLIVLAVIAVFCVAAAGALSTRFVLARAASPDSLRIPGTVVAARADVMSSVAGKVVALPVAAGDHVAGGQTVAVLSNPSVTAQASLARARLAAAVAPFGPYSLSVPAGGTVLKVYRSVGSLVMTGDPILALGDPNTLHASVSTADVQSLPLVGQTAWVRSVGSAPIAATVDTVDRDHVTALLPAGSGLRLDDPVEVRFDVGQPGDPVVTYRGLITASVVVLRAQGDGQITSVAAEGDALASRSIAVQVSRSATPDAAETLAIDEARAAVQQAEEQLSALTISAPTGGAISTVDVSIGQDVTAGTFVAQIIGESGLQVKLTVNENQQALWVRGTQVKIIGDADMSADGCVSAASASGADLAVTVELPAGAVLREGQSVMVAPTLPAGAVVVPVRSVGGSGTSRWVSTLAFSGGVRRHSVTVLAVNGQFAVVSGIGARSLVALAP